MYHKNDAANQLLQSSATRSIFRSAGTVVRPPVIKLAIVVAALLVAPLVGEAQRAGKVYRVGYLGGQSESAVVPFPAVFRQGMQKLGYVEGRNLMLVARFAEGKLDRFPSLAQELVRLNPDVLFVATTVGAQAARAATATIPIVFIEVGDPVGVGLVPNLARPGGNITGITGMTVELTGKRLELLKETVPTRRSVLLAAAQPHASAGRALAALAPAAERDRWPDESDFVVSASRATFASICRVWGARGAATASVAAF